MHPKVQAPSFEFLRQVEERVRTVRKETEERVTRERRSAKREYPESILLLALWEVCKESGNPRGPLVRPHRPLTWIARASSLMWQHQREPARDFEKIKRGTGN